MGQRVSMVHNQQNVWVIYMRQVQLNRFGWCFVCYARMNGTEADAQGDEWTQKLEENRKCKESGR